MLRIVDPAVDSTKIKLLRLRFRKNVPKNALMHVQKPTELFYILPVYWKTVHFKEKLQEVIKILN